MNTGMNSVPDVRCLNRVLMREMAMPKRGEPNGTGIRTYERWFTWPTVPLFVAILLAAGASGLDDREQAIAAPVPYFYPVSLVLAALLIGCLIAIAGMTESRPLRIALVLGPMLAFGLYAITFYLAEKRAGGLADPERSGGSTGAGDASASGVWTAAIAGAVLLLVAGLGLAVLLRRPAPADGAEPARADPEVVRQTSDAIAAGQAALRDHADDRAAVIACYAAMEEALRGHGVRRRVADTPTELLERAGSSGLHSIAGEAAAVVLVGLFQRARFSTGPLPATARDEAESALERLGMDLDSAVAAGEARR